MKKVIAYSLILSFLIQLLGCSTFQPIESTVANDLSNLDNQSVKITLSTGEEIISKEYHHLYFTEPSEFIFCIGSISDKNLNNTRSFSGLIPAEEIKSIYFDEKIETYNILLKTEELTIVRKGNYFKATYETEPGFWYWDKEKAVKVNVTDVKLIETSTFNAWLTTIFIIGTLGVVALVFALNYSPDGLGLDVNTF